MITLKEILGLVDYKFTHFDLKMLLQRRNAKTKIDIKEKDNKNIDIGIVKLAEQGQVEAMEMYFRNLPVVSNMNTKIVANIRNLEGKSVKEPRDCMAIYAFYNWYVERDIYNKIENAESSENAKRAEFYYNTAYAQLKKKSPIDLLARESAFLIEMKRKENEESTENSIIISNLRNQLLDRANQVVNDITKIKHFYAYARNLIIYASENEFLGKQELLTKIITLIQSIIAKYIVHNDTKIAY